MQFREGLGGLHERCCTNAAQSRFVVVISHLRNDRCWSRAIIILACVLAAVTDALCDGSGGSA
jgi:hypothetical protein